MSNSLISKRRDAIRRARELVRTAETDKRPLTDAERVEFDECLQTAHELDASIADGRDRNPAGRDGPLGDPLDRPLNVHEPLRRDQSVQDWVQSHVSGEDHRQGESLSLGQLARAMALGPRTDEEKRALSEGTDSAGGFTVPTILTAALIDALREDAVVFRAGARTLPLESFKNDFARLDADPGVTWHTENTAESSTDITFSQVRFQAKTAMVLTRASRELAEDSVNLDDALFRAFSGGIAGAVDQAVISGTTATTQPTGVLNTTTISTVTAGSTNGHKLTQYSPLVSAYEQSLNNNSPATAVVTATREYADLADLRDANAQPLEKPTILRELPMLPSNRMPTNETIGTSTSASSMIFGMWDDCVVGIRSAFRLEVLRERYADSLQFGFLGFMRLDMQLFHPLSFVRLQGIDPAGTS